jgi:hypothetical protein
VAERPTDARSLKGVEELDRFDVDRGPLLQLRTGASGPRYAPRGTVYVKVARSAPSLTVIR